MPIIFNGRSAIEHRHGTSQVKRHKKLWGGRFVQPARPIRSKRLPLPSLSMRGFTATTSCGSIAHAKMLAQQRIIPRSDAPKIVRGLARIQREIDERQVCFFSGGRRHSHEHRTAVDREDRSPPAANCTRRAAATIKSLWICGCFCAMRWRDHRRSRHACNAS